MSKQIKADSRMKEIVRRLNAHSEKWQKYDEASENQAMWKKQFMKVQEDIGDFCVEAGKELEKKDKNQYVYYDASAAWMELIDKLKQYDPDREHKDGTKVLLGEYLSSCIGNIIKKVINDERYDPGLRGAMEAERKKNERNRKKGKPETEKNVGNISLDTVAGGIVDKQGNQSESSALASTVNVEEQVWENMEGSEMKKGDKLVSDLVLTMMAMSLNFEDYRRRLQKRGRAEPEIYMKMCYTERLVWLEMVEQILFEMDRNARKDILRAMLNSYYWYWADGKMVYDAEWELKPVCAEEIVTAEIKKLRWMRRTGGENKGWLELDIPVDYIKDSRDENVNRARVSEARTRYMEDLSKLNEMAYGRDGRA